MTLFFGEGIKKYTGWSLFHDEKSERNNIILALGWIVKWFYPRAVGKHSQVKA